MDGSGWSTPLKTDGSTTTTSSSASSGSRGKSSSTESADNEEQEDSSSTLVICDNNNTVEDELSDFRRKWQKELQISKDGEKTVNVNKAFEDYAEDENLKTKEETIEDEAKRWFLQGVENEKSGKLYEAILSYKKAVQLVPDIEFRLCEPQRQKNFEESSSLGSEESESELMKKPDQSRVLQGLKLILLRTSSNRSLLQIRETTEERSEYPETNLIEEDEDDADEVDLVMKLQRLFSRSKAICEPENEQKTTHISALPVEIILYIFRWVVSHDLDLRSLEMCSMVCRGFYLCSRDPEIWRVACLKVWGMTCGGLSNFNNWRTMYLGRPRLNFNGCYISKTTYIRHGENSFQDQFYRPWHVVEYFRYLRFFPEGAVLMLTTADQPAPVLNLLKKRESRNPSILTGHYRLHDDKVTVVLRPQDLLNKNRYRGRRNNIPIDLVEQTFHIELRVITKKNRLNSQLLWRRYTVMSKRGNTDTKTNFDVTSNKFPPFWFSRVKSYTAESDKPL